MDSVMKLSTSSRCIKYLMFIFNLLFVISGIILLSIGATIHAVFRSHQHFLDNSFLSVPNLLIAIGTIIFFIAFFGCCGAVKENYCMILTFVSLMVLVFILELAGGISGYVLRNEAQEVVREKMLETLPKYQNGSEIFNMWDQLQADFHCCGVDGAEDWVKHLVTNNSQVPMSCCLPQNGIIGEATCNVNSTNLYHAGCFTKFVSFIGGHAVQLGGVGLGIAFIQLTGVMIIFVGTKTLHIFNDFYYFLVPIYFSPSTLLIVVGVLTFVIAFFGCCGALKESTCMVLVFAVSLSLVLALEVAAAITAYVLQDGVVDYLSHKMTSMTNDYTIVPGVREAVDFMQSTLHCCGVHGPEDWSYVNEALKTPASCYRWHAMDENNVIRDIGLYETGCIYSLSMLVHRSALNLGTAAMAIALIQLTGIMFACTLGRAIRRQKTNRERRRWELRQSLVNGYHPLGKTDPQTTFPVIYMQPDFTTKTPVQ
ncbi:tetraspanin-12-like [Venturia canescens]|uniref:tetraspanin-12-like n=1 Tax=Venturia canescens TaxID=32260 RepID=UPI001C9CCEAF|nr:tetraspanin-12-like [Venturia canescens]